MVISTNSLCWFIGSSKTRPGTRLCARSGRITRNPWNRLWNGEWVPYVRGLPLATGAYSCRCTCCTNQWIANRAKLNPGNSSWSRIYFFSFLCCRIFCRALWHFDLKKYRPSEQNRVKTSLAAVFGFMAVVWPLIIWKFGVVGWVNYWLMPWLGYHFWVSFEFLTY